MNLRIILKPPKPFTEPSLFQKYIYFFNRYPLGRLYIKDDFIVGKASIVQDRMEIMTKNYCRSFAIRNFEVFRVYKIKERIKE